MGNWFYIIIAPNSRKKAMLLVYYKKQLVNIIIVLQARGELNHVTVAMLLDKETMCLFQCIGRKPTLVGLT